MQLAINSKRLTKDKKQTINHRLSPHSVVITGPTQGSAANEKILIKPAAELHEEVLTRAPCWFLEGSTTIKGQEKLLKPL